MPVVVFGFSFGGLVTVHSLALNELSCDAVILHAPLVTVAPDSSVHPAVVSIAEVRVALCREFLGAAHVRMVGQPQSMMRLSKRLGYVPLVHPTRGKSHHPSVRCRMSDVLCVSWD